MTTQEMFNAVKVALATQGLIGNVTLFTSQIHQDTYVGTQFMPEHLTDVYVYSVYNNDTMKTMLVITGYCDESPNYNLPAGDSVTAVRAFNNANVMEVQVTPTVSGLYCPFIMYMTEGGNTPLTINPAFTNIWGSIATTYTSATFRTSFSISNYFTQAGNADTLTVSYAGHFSKNDPTPGGGMELKLWKGFKKRKNSTKRPTGGTTYTVVLKDDTSILSPHFILQDPEINYNYCQFNGRYYYIEDTISLANGLIELVCKVDPYASGKGDIQAYTGFVLYDTSTASDLVDTRIPLVTTPTIAVATPVELRNDVYVEGSRGGSYVISMTGEKQVGTYVVTEETLNYLIPDITTVWDTFIGGTNPFDAIKDGLKQLVGSGDLNSNIRDVRWIPFLLTPQSTDVTEQLMCGMYQVLNSNGVQVSGTRLVKRLLNKTATISIPWQFNDWRNSSHCTDIILYIPFVGNIHVSADSLKGQSSITVETSLNRTTGDLAFLVKAGSVVIGTYGASTGINLALGTSQINPLTLGMSVLGAAATGGVGAVASAMVASKPLDTCVGGIGSGAGAGLDTHIQCITVCHDTIELPSAANSVHGTPTFKTKSLASLSGYVQTLGANVETSLTESEKQAIDSGLDAGLFLE